MDSTKVLLTGGAGFIGSHTAVELSKAGYEPVIVDDLSNAKADVIDRIEKITGKSVAFYKANCCDAAALDKVFGENDISCVIHFAGFKAVGESVKLPLKYYRNNLDSTLTLLEVMKKHSVGKIVFSSSATVYGASDVMPLVETMPTGKCTNPYGKTKLMIEEILTDAAAADNTLTAVMLRYFNPIGAHESGLLGEDPNGIPNNLMPYITQVACGKIEKLSVFGNDYNTPDGTGVRDYIHVVDLARGHVKAVKYAESFKGSDVINLGTGIGYSVIDIVKAFEKANNIKVPYVIAPRRPGDIDVCYSDPYKAREKLGWTAEKSLEDMCRDSWHWQTCNNERNK